MNRPSSSVLLLLLVLADVAKTSSAAPPVPIESAGSGNWSAPATWKGGAVPAAGSTVLIREGHRVRYDVESDEVVRSLHVSGTLSFAPDRDTLLNVGLVRIEPGNRIVEDGFDCEHVEKTDPAPAKDGAEGAGQPGFTAICLCCESKAALLVGTPEEPIDAAHTARIRLHHVPGTDAKSWPAIVCCGGRMDFHGAPLSRSWTKLGATVNEGKDLRNKKTVRDPVVVLAEPVAGWKPGDRIVVTGTRGYREAGYFVDGITDFDITLRKSAVFGEPPIRPDKQKKTGPSNPPVFSEERTIVAVDGARIEVDRPFDLVHLGTGDFRGEVANLSRNVIVESAAPDGVRGHTMYHRGSAGSISHAEFRHLGKENVLGRYAIHFHLCGDTMRGSSVVGASIVDSRNRWITIHGTEYLVVRDCVGYRSVGHGFFLEDGTEVHNVLDRNLAIQSFRGKPLPGQVLPYDPNDGSGFWWANPLNSFTRNVAVECDAYGFHHEVKPVSVPVPNLHTFNHAKTSSVGTPLDPKEFRGARNIPENPHRFALTFPVRRPDGTREPIDVRTLPFVRFDDNEAHSNLLWGVGLGTGASGVGPDRAHPLVVRNLRIWQFNAGYGVEIPCVKIEGMHFWSIPHTSYSFWNPIFRDQDYADVTFKDVFERRLPGQNKSADQLSLGNRITYVAGGVGGPREGEHADLEPVDDLPPITVVTGARRTSTGALRVAGTCSDDGRITRVLVNGREAKSLEGNFARWEIDLTDLPPEAGLYALTAYAEDAAGNVEITKHATRLTVRARAD